MTAPRSIGYAAISRKPNHNLLDDSYRVKPVRLIHILFFVLLATAWVIAGCGHTKSATVGDRAQGRNSQPGDQQQRIEDLTRALRVLGSGTGDAEAVRVANTSVTYSAELARNYRSVRPPELHNILVRLGLKKRGLCYHWADDLLAKLRELDLVHLHLQRAVTHQGSDLYEHHSVVVTAKGRAFQDGIVLDPWRSSGELFWAPVSGDRHPWVPLNGHDRSVGGADTR